MHEVVVKMLNLTIKLDNNIRLNIWYLQQKIELYTLFLKSKLSKEAVNNISKAVHIIYYNIHSKRELISKQRSKRPTLVWARSILLW